MAVCVCVRGGGCMAVCLWGCMAVAWLCMCGVVRPWMWHCCVFEGVCVSGCGLAVCVCGWGGACMAVHVWRCMHGCSMAVAWLCTWFVCVAVAWLQVVGN